MSISYASLSTDFGFEKASMPLEMQSALFSLFTSAAAILMFYLLLVRFPWFADKLHEGLRKTVAMFKGKTQEARLNKVVCYHCNKGMGLYNPVYFMVHGEPHIEGTCSLCGGFVRVSLKS